MAGGGARWRRHAVLRQWTFAVVLGSVLVLAGLLPPLTARGDATTEVTGSVVSDGRAVAGMTVGFWSPTDGVVKHTTTNAAGRFTLEVPFAVEGYAYAGTAPDSTEAIATVNGHQYVRGVINTVKHRGVTAPLYQGYTAGTARSLNNGDDLDFVLEAPGRVAGISPLLERGGGTVRLERLDGSVVETFADQSTGRYTSRELAPGTYQVATLPDSPYVAQRVRVAVTAGATSAVAPQPLRRGATVRGQILSDGAALRSAVPVVVRKAGVQVESVMSSTSGAYAVDGLSAGTYQLTFGRYPDTVDAGGRVLETSTRTADDYRPASVTVTVDALLDDVQQEVSLDPAGHIAGTVSGADGQPVEVLLEDQGTGAVLHATTAAAGTGAFSFGGLDPGAAFQVYAVDDPTDGTAARYGTDAATAAISATSTPIALDQDAPTLTGSVSGTTSAAVQAGTDAVFSRSAVVSGGSYRLVGLVPGSWQVVVNDGAHADSDPVTVTIPAGVDSVTQDLQVGPGFATYRAWFISNGAPVSFVSGIAVSDAGDVLTIGPRTDRGYVTVTGLQPGTYRYLASSFIGIAPASDGPWWFDPPTGTFALRGGQTTDVGPIVLRSRATR